MTESKNDVRPRVPTTSISEWPDAEVFLLTAFRRWFAHKTGDIACWELAWQGVSRKRPLADAKRIIAELGQFTRVFRQTLTCRFVSSRIAAVELRTRSASRYSWWHVPSRENSSEPLNSHTSSPTMMTMPISSVPHRTR